MSERVDDPEAGYTATGPAPVPQSSPSLTPPPGWYLDPWDRAQHRFWDGEAWTAETFPNGPARNEDQGSRGSPWTPSTGSARPDWIAAPVDDAVGESGPWAWASPSDTVVPPPEWAEDLDPTLAAGLAVAQAAHERVPDRGLPTGRTLAAIALVVGLVVGFVAAVGIVTAVDHDPKPKSNAAADLPQPAITIPPNLGSILPATPATPTRPTPTAPTSPAPSGPSATVLNALVLHQSEVASSVTVQTLAGGDQVAGQPTLDLCNGTFPSESLRTARLQVVAVDDQGNSVLSTEAVLYASSAATAQAFAELRSTGAKCPATPVSSPVGEPTVTTRFNAAPDGAWPQTATVERLAFDFVSTDDTGQAQHSVAVYLRRGRVLMGVYFAQPDGAQPAVAGQTTIAGIVNVFAGRMAQLPSSAVNGG